MTAPGGQTQLQAGDADQDLDFDQLDLVARASCGQVPDRTGGYLGRRRLDGAPGGSQGSPPSGDGKFDQLDVIAALGNGLYLAGPYGAINRGGQAGDAQASIGYNARSGEVWVDVPAETDLTSVNIESASGIFTGQPAQNLGGSFDNDSDTNIFKATFGSSFGSLSFGQAAHAGLTEDFVAGDLSVVGSLAGGGALGNVDLIYVPVPEPGTLLLLALGVAVIAGMRRVAE